MEVEKSYRVDSRIPSLDGVHYSLAAKVMAYDHLERDE